MPLVNQKARWNNHRLIYRHVLKDVENPVSTPAPPDVVAPEIQVFSIGKEVATKWSPDYCFATGLDDSSFEKARHAGNRQLFCRGAHHGASGSTVMAFTENVVSLMATYLSSSAGFWGGTSMATPHVAGLAALLTCSHVISAIPGPSGDADDMSNVARLRALLTRNAATHPTGMYFDWFQHHLPKPQDRPGQEEDQHVDRPLDWFHSPAQVLQHLERAESLQERATAALFAETTEFPPNEIPRLLNGLARFIDENRFTTDEEITTSVAAAIRKYAMNMGEDRFESYSDWLLPSQTATLGHELELELTKALGWRLMYEPLTAVAGFPHLLQVLSELCKGYLTPRLVLQKNYAGTVVHCIIGVAILEALAGQKAQTEALLDLAVNLKVNWFTEVLSDRIAESIAALLGHTPGLAKRLQAQVATQLPAADITNHAGEDAVR